MCFPSQSLVPLGVFNSNPPLGAMLSDWVFRLDVDVLKVLGAQAVIVGERTGEDRVAALVVAGWMNRGRARADLVRLLKVTIRIHVVEGLKVCCDRFRRCYEEVDTKY